MEKDIKKAVREGYARIAEQASSCCGPVSSCCTPEDAVSASCCSTDTTCCQPQNLAARLYTSEELEKLPKEIADISLGCGNPTAIAELSEGEVVLDLGSGGGLDCFLAAQKVGERGRVIGLDMTPEMVRLARANAQKIGASNVEFRLGEMEHIPVEDNSIDVIISNCVINLSPDKDAVFREAYRVLKPGGRLCVSDIVLLGELPEEVKESLDQWVGCVAGAIEEKTYLNKMEAAGLAEITTDKSTIPFYAECETPQTQNTEGQQNYLDLSEKVASIKVKAFKPDKA
jgi:arsenite methyltransferase